MATDIVGSLFGVTPEGLDAARQQQMREQAMAYAQLTPQQQITYGAALGGQQFGRSIGGLLGAEDPEMRLVRLRSSITQTMDPTNIESLTGAIQKLQSAGDTVGALNLTNILRNLQKTQAETIKATREGTPKESQIAASRADAIATRGTPEWATAYKNSLEQQVRFTTDAQRNAAEYASTKNEFGSQQWNTAYKAKLEELLKKEKTGQIKEVGVAIGTQTPVYLDPNTDQQYIYVKGQDGKQVRQPYFGGVDRTTSKVSVKATAGEKGDVAWEEALSKADVKYLSDLREKRDSAKTMIQSLNTLSGLDDNGLVSGSFAGQRVGVANFLNTVGLISPETAKTMSNSQQYQTTINQLTMDILGGKLGAGISNEDRNLIARMLPQLETSATARREIINALGRSATNVISEFDQANEYARTNRGFKNYRPSMPEFSPIGKPKGSSSQGNPAEPTGKVVPFSSLTKG